MGNNTYKKILKLGIEYPHKDKVNFVLTSNKKINNDENVNFLSRNIVKTINALKQNNGKNIWLVGGGKINSYFLKNKLIDEIKFFAIPIILGKGIPLFDEIPLNCKLLLTSSKKYDTGVVELNYTCKYER
jgi:dihydrofolate reductase